MKVELEDLVLRYGDDTALDSLTLTLEPGKIYGLLGRNGAGKTSLLSVLAGFRKHTSGTVRVDGAPVFENAERTRDICLIRDTGEAIGLGTAQDALYFAEWLRPDWDGGYAERLMKTFGIERKMNVAKMSKGKRAAMNLIIGLASRAPLTLLDESYLGLDVPSRQRFYDTLLADYMEHPRTIVLSTHLIDEVAPLFEEVVIIDRGRLLVHEEAERLARRGVAVTGRRDAVDAFTAGRTVLHVRDLGPTRAAMIYGEADAQMRRQAAEDGLELGPVAMQELFVHLTGDAR